MDGQALTCRVVRMIVAGGLDGATEVDLGSRVGASARHLRRLFNHYAGITPHQLARAVRAHRALHLLETSDWRVADIAYAAGFQSLRQFNRALKYTFGATPRELRMRHTSDRSGPTDGALSLRVAPAGTSAMPIEVAVHPSRWSELVHVVQGVRQTIETGPVIVGIAA